MSSIDSEKQWAQEQEDRYSLGNEQTKLVEDFVVDLNEQLRLYPIDQCKICLDLPIPDSNLEDHIPFLKSLVDKFQPGFVVELSYLVTHIESSETLTNLIALNYDEKNFEAIVELGLKPVFKHVECKLCLELAPDTEESATVTKYHLYHVNQQNQTIPPVKFTDLIDPLRKLNEKLGPLKFLLSASSEVASEMDDYPSDDWQVLIDSGAILSTGLPIVKRLTNFDDQNKPIDLSAHAKEVLALLSNFMSKFPSGQLQIHELLLDMNFLPYFNRTELIELFTGIHASCFSTLKVINVIQFQENDISTIFDVTILSAFRDTVVELYFPLSGLWQVENMTALLDFTKLQLLSMGLPLNDISTTISSLHTLQSVHFQYFGIDSSSLTFLTEMTSLKMIQIAAPNILDINSLSLLGNNSPNDLVLILDLGDQVDSLDPLGKIPNLTWLSVDGCKPCNWQIPVMPKLTYLDLEKLNGEIIDHSSFSNMLVLDCYRLPNLKCKDNRMLVDICTYCSHVRIVQNVWFDEKSRQVICRNCKNDKDVKADGTMKPKEDPHNVLPTWLTWLLSILLVVLAYYIPAFNK